ncbi:MAG: MoaF N-terminal domain-containing protein [Alphaproteobacteria bacterium]
MGTPYPKEQMHRIAYTKLSEDQISEKLSKVLSSGPKCASPPSDALAGKQIKIVTDKGPSLAYKFASANRLSVAENGGAAVEAGYGAQVLDHVVFFTHLVPGTQRGYSLIIDQHTNQATVFELWFSGYKDNREVQREIHFGYVDEPGKKAPEKRHALTNRMQGHGYYWKQDNGVETLEFYPSVMYAHFVELSRFGGELGFCAPSDYIKITDELYIHSRAECELSGIHTMYVLDLNRIEQVGMRLGFDDKDALEYYVFRGKGEWLGQLAHFEQFGDLRGAPPPASQDGKPPAKGARGVYRPMATMHVMTKAEVDAAVAKRKVAFPVRGPGEAAPISDAMGANSGPQTDWLAGRKFTLRYDHEPAIEYEVDEAETLRWRKAGQSGWTKARYRAWESMPGVIIFGHFLDGEPNHNGHSIVCDFHHGLVTCFNGFANTPYIANEMGVRVMFGVIEMEGLNAPKYRRHQFTDEMCGRAVTWNYMPGTFGRPNEPDRAGLTSMHLYTTPHSLSWIIFQPNGAGGMEWSGPSAQVKIREGLYFIYWLEEACNGALGTVLVNMRTMHDAGIGFHCGPDGINMMQVGAHARHAGKFDVARFYQIKS